jgi:hypothetical protein
MKQKKFQNLQKIIFSKFEKTILCCTRRQAAVATETRTAGCTRRASTTLTSRPTHIPPENAVSVSAALEKSAKKLGKNQPRSFQEKNPNFRVKLPFLEIIV